MRALFRFVPGLALTAVLACGASTARATIVERIVAVVGDRPILLSELRLRARPYLLQIAQKAQPGPQRAAAESQLFKELIDKMVDEELEVQAAEHAKIAVTSTEIDSSINNLAASQGITPDELMKTVLKAGMSEVEYRSELRRQILEVKMLQLRVKGHVLLSEEDVKSMYDRTLREERHHRDYRARWIVLRLLPGSSKEALLERRVLAEDLARRARSGDDFGVLATRYSDNTPTRDTGGDLGVRTPHGSQKAVNGTQPTLAPELENAVMPLEPGQVSAPISIADALVILQLTERQPSRYASFDAAKGEMLQRLQSEIMEKAKRKWLDELKVKTHLDVRL